MSNKITRLFTEPLIQFLLIGACIYGAYAMFGAPEEQDSDMTVLVDANRVASFVGQWTSRWNRPPTREELDGLINSYVKEEILYRQAVSMGLNEDDAITRRRMAQKLEFLTNDLVRMAEPGEGELEAFLQENLAQFTAPDQISFYQAFFDPDARGDSTLDDADEALLQLREAGDPDPASLEVGDQLMLTSYYANVSETEVRRAMGSGFVESLMALEPGVWHGPVLSGYGVHLVYIFEIIPARVPTLEDVQAEILEAWHFAQIEKFNTEFYDSLKSRYLIIIDDKSLEPGSILEVEAQGDEAADVLSSEPDTGS